MHVFGMAPLLLGAASLRVVAAASSVFTFQGTDGGIMEAGTLLQKDYTLWLNGARQDENDESSHCFLKKLQAETLELLGEWTYKSGVEESCLSMTIDDNYGNMIQMAGTTKAGGLLDASNSKAADLYGMILHISTTDGQISILKSTLLDELPIQSPKAITSDDDNDATFVASQVSHDGTKSSLMIHRLDKSSSSSWTRVFSNSFYQTDQDASIHVGNGMLVKGNDLIVVGSTKASGPAFGYNKDETQDGFVIKVSRDTGELVAGDGLHPYLRVNKENGDDSLVNICNDPNDSNAFYVVGTIQGNMGEHLPTLIKVQKSNLRILWEHTLHAAAGNTSGAVNAMGMACVAYQDKVYLAGVAKDETQVDATSSHGKDDVFVEQVSSLDGSSQWIRQVGTAVDEQLADNGLIVNAHGNPILYGVTKESSLPFFDGGSNVFVFGFNAVDGSSTRDAGIPPETCNECVATQIEANAPTFAGGIAYHDHNIWFTGATYANDTYASDTSSCFVGRLSLQDATATLTPIAATDNIEETCRAMDVSRRNSESFLAGTTLEGGLLTQFASSTAAQFGMVLQANPSLQFTGGFLLEETSTVTYPIALVAGSESIEYIFVASMSSDDDSSDSRTNPGAAEDPTKILSLGSRYKLRLSKLQVMGALDPDQEELKRQTMETKFDKTFGNHDGNSVYTTGMISVSKGLVVVGNTRGNGNHFGTGDGEHMDGWIFVVDPTTGDVTTSSRFSNSGGDNWIKGVCSDPNDSDTLYIVGATTTGGDEEEATAGSIHPFVAKISVDDLETRVWYKLLKTRPPFGSSGATEAQLLGCAVDGISGTIYAAGVVKDDAAMVYSVNDPQLASGKDDLFVANLSKGTGAVSWVRQMGTPKKEGMGGIAVDTSNGNAIILGHTKGYMYRSPTAEDITQLDRKLDHHQGLPLNEIVLFSIDKHGIFQAPLNVPSLEAETDGEESNTSSKGGNTIPATTKIVDAFALEGSWDKFSFAMLIVGPIILLMFLCLFCRSVARKNAQKQNQRKTLAVFKYLRSFDCKDIDLRRSPAGGYNGTYINDLADGNKISDRLKKKDDRDADRPDLANSSNVDDYLSMSNSALSRRV